MISELEENNIAKKRKTEQIMVPVWFNPTTFQAVCADAKKAGFRPVLLQEQVLKPHGFPGQKAWQRKGIARFLKFCRDYWLKTEAERLAKAAEIARKEKELGEEKKRLGMV